MAKITDINKIGTEIIELTNENVRPMFHLIRGQQVMLDADLAAIYGYSTRDFNKQVKNNIEKFPDDFRFQLTTQEVANLRWKFSTSNCGASSKDGGNKVMTISLVTEAQVYHQLLDTALSNDTLTLN